MKPSPYQSELARAAVTLGFASLGFLGACASNAPATDSPQGGSVANGGSQANAGSSTTPTGGIAATGGNTSAGSATAGAETAGANAAGSAGLAGSPTNGGASGTAGGGGTAPLPDVGSDGDGDSTSGDYVGSMDLTDQGNPKGKSFSFTMQLAASKFFDGKDPTLTSTASTTRSVNVYVPAKYQDGTPAAVLVIQDGPGQINQVSRALDNLTIETDPLRRLPPFVVVAAQNGGGDSIGSERGLEYDTVSDKYARFVDAELLPAVVNDAKVKAAYPGLKFTTDSSGRGALGCSSGAVAAFTMAWLRPDLFSRVAGYSTTLVAQQNPNAPEAAMYPDGAWDYHSINELIKNDTEGREKKLRIFINANEQDNGYMAAESGKHNWLMANQRTAAALKAKGFHYKFIEGLGEGHCAPGVQSSTLADVLMWLWRGYQPADH